MALPYINLYIGDIKKDTDLLSPAAFGSYMRLLLFTMHESKPTRGEVSYTLPQLCRIFAAKDLEETLSIVHEITDPTFDIVDFSEADGKYFFRNRRMVREAAISEARRKAGAKGAEVTNTKNQQNKKLAEEFAATKPAATDSPNNTANSASNDSAKGGQNYNNNTNTNINTIEDVVRGPGEEEGTFNGPTVETGFSVLIVPELLQVFRSKKPKYIFQKEKDFPALLKIAETIADQEGVFIHEKDGVDRIKTIWQGIVEFMQTDKLYKDFQISQVEKYFQTIVSKYSASLENPQGETPKGKTSVIGNNITGANDAREIVRKKYEGGSNGK